MFGTDYDTPDGTCVRDYIHVTDLAAAHLAALDALRDGADSMVLNCGYGRGFSVRDVIGAVERASGRMLPVEDGPRRAGDPPALVADAMRIHEQLGWQPRHGNLDVIVEHALRWEDRLSERLQSA